MRGVALVPAPGQVPGQGVGADGIFVEGVAHHVEVVDAHVGEKHIGLGDVVGAGGVSPVDVERDVELKLRLAGITIHFALTAGTLGVNVAGACNSDGLCTYSIDLHYNEDVFVQRGDENVKIHFVATWTTLGAFGTVGSSKVRNIRDEVKELVDEFVNAYLTANPKR